MGPDELRELMQRREAFEAWRSLKGYGHGAVKEAWDAALSHADQRGYREALEKIAKQCSCRGALIARDALKEE